MNLFEKMITDFQETRVKGLHTLSAEVLIGAMGAILKGFLEYTGIDYCLPGLHLWTSSFPPPFCLILTSHLSGWSVRQHQTQK